MKRRGKTTGEAAKFELFPFLAVLLCTMGSLIMMLVVIARNAQQNDRQRQQAALEVHEDLEGKISTAEWYAEQLKESRDKTQKQLAEQRAELSHLEDHFNRLRDEMEKIDATLAEMERGKLNGTKRTEDLRGELAEAEAKVRAKQDEIERMRERASKEKPSFSIIPYHGPNQTHRRPIYIECLSDRVIIQPEGVVLVESDFMGRMGPANALAASMRIVREHVAHLRLARATEGEPYPLLLVRPEGIGAYYAAREAMTSWGSEFGYEFIDQDWKIDFPAADAQLALAMSRAVEDARRRQVMLARAAPGLLSAEERLAFGNAMGGGSGGFPGGKGNGGGGGRGNGAAGGNMASGNSAVPGGNGGAGRGGNPLYGLAGSGGGSGGRTETGRAGSIAGGGEGVNPYSGIAGIGTGGNGTGTGTGTGSGNGSGSGPGGNRMYQQGQGSAMLGAGVEPSMGQGAGDGQFTGTGAPGNQVAGNQFAGNGGGGKGSASQGTVMGPGAGGQLAEGGASGASGGGGRGNSSKGSSSNGGGKYAANGGSGGRGNSSSGGGSSSSNSGGGGMGSSGSGSSGSAGSMGSAGSPGASGMPPGMASPNLNVTLGQQPQQQADKQDRGPRQSLTSLSHTRGNGWGLPEDMQQGPIAVTRPIRIDCYGDRLVLRDPGGNSRNDKTVPLGDRTQDAVDQLVGHLHQEISSWGIAGRNMGWRPELVMGVAPDGEDRYADLCDLLSGSGLEIRDSTIVLSPGQTRTTARR